VAQSRTLPPRHGSSTLEKPRLAPLILDLHEKEDLESQLVLGRSDTAREALHCFVRRMEPEQRFQRRENCEGAKIGLLRRHPANGTEEPHA
jgi:hypothetical protein